MHVACSDRVLPTHYACNNVITKLNTFHDPAATFPHFIKWIPTWSLLHCSCVAHACIVSWTRWLGSSSFILKHLTLLLLDVTPKALGIYKRNVVCIIIQSEERAWASRLTFNFACNDNSFFLTWCSTWSTMWDQLHAGNVYQRHRIFEGWKWQCSLVNTLRIIMIKGVMSLKGSIICKWNSVVVADPRHMYSMCSQSLHREEVCTHPFSKKAPCGGKCVHSGCASTRERNLRLGYYLII